MVVVNKVDLVDGAEVDELLRAAQAAIDQDPLAHGTLLAAAAEWAEPGTVVVVRGSAAEVEEWSALLAVTGVLVLFWPALATANTNLAGEFCGLAASLLWANYNHQSRILSAQIPGVQIAANAMWMSGVWLLPFGLIEVGWHGLVLDARHLGVQSLCIVFGGVVPYALWNSALRHWRTSRVMLFNNFIPLTTTVWVYLTLGEPITPTFCTAMALIVAGVAIGQMDWAKIFKMPESF